MNKRIPIIGFVLGLIGLFVIAKPLIAPTLEKQIGSVTDKTYINSKYGFQLKYPGGWQIEEWDIESAANLKKVADGTILYQGKFFGTSGHFEILIWENKSRAAARQWLTWFRHEDLILSSVPPKENFMTAGLPAIRFLQKETSRKKPILFVFLGKDDKIYEFTEEREDLSSLEATQSARFIHPIYDRILGSFQFR